MFDGIFFLFYEFFQHLIFRISLKSLGHFGTSRSSNLRSNSLESARELRKDRHASLRLLSRLLRSVSAAAADWKALAKFRRHAIATAHRRALFFLSFAASFFLFLVIQVFDLQIATSRASLTSDREIFVLCASRFIRLESQWLHYTLR